MRGSGGFAESIVSLSLYRICECKRKMKELVLRILLYQRQQSRNYITGNHLCLLVLAQAKQDKHVLQAMARIISVTA